MDIHNLLTLAFIALKLHYLKFKNDYRKKGIVLYFDLSRDYEDKCCNNPFGLRIIVRSIKTKKIETHTFSEDIINVIDEPAEKLIIPKIKEMIRDVNNSTNINWNVLKSYMALVNLKCIEDLN